jgi:hypothetical protein
VIRVVFCFRFSLHPITRWPDHPIFMFPLLH